MGIIDRVKNLFRPKKKGLPKPTHMSQINGSYVKYRVRDNLFVEGHLIKHSYNRECYVMHSNDPNVLQGYILPHWFVEDIDKTTYSNYEIKFIDGLNHFNRYYTVLEYNN